MTLVRLEPAVLRSRVKHITTEPLQSVVVVFLLLSPYLCFISYLYLDLYVLGDDDLIS